MQSLKKLSIKQIGSFELEVGFDKLNPTSMHEKWKI